MTKSNVNKTNQLFPSIDGTESAQEVARQGVWASLLVAGFTTFFILLSFAGVSFLNAWSFLDVAAFVAIAYGIHKMSRIAAMVGLALYVAERVVLWSNPMFKPNAVGLIMTIFITFAFINAVRGTFAYHQYRRQEF